MLDPTVELFDRLRRHGHEPLLEHVEGSVRFDLADESGVDHWTVTISRGDLSVTREDRDADCIVSSAKARFDRVATGEDNAIAMLLRAEIVATGDVELLVVLERLLPGPPGASDPVAAARSEAASR
jgi:predicted lipid carrier protein YhbT